jgi:hypothetical protein
MASRGVRSPLSIFFVFFYFCACVFLFGGVFSGGFGLSASAFGQASDNLSSKKSSGSSSPAAGQPRGSGNNNNNDRNVARPYPRDQPHWNWNQRGRSVPPGESTAALRLRAYRQKMAWRAQRAKLPPKQSLGGAPAPASIASSTMWTPLGPAPLDSDASGKDEVQIYNWVSGRATSVVIDPADTTGNTVLLGGAYGGLWKSTNAGSLSPDPSPGPASVVWLPLLDDQPTLAVGAIALQPGNSSVILVGTGETNNSADSYYGLGILRSTNGGSTWTQITGVGQTPDNSFLGIGFSKIAFSTANPNLVVAATAGDNGLCLDEESATAGNTGPCLGPQEDGNSPARGLYYSTNAGATWSRATLTDGSVAASATSVIYNPTQGAFYAAIRRHGIYSSTDGINFTPLATQPSAGLASANCPASANATSCIIYRGEFAVVPGRNEMYVWIVDVQGDFTYGNPVPADEGIWQSINGGASWTLIPDNGITNCGDDAFGPNSGCGVEQGWYNLALAAIPDSTTTDIYAGAVNLYKCTLQPGSATCTQTNNDWINLTHVYGCSPLGAPAQVHPSQHGIAFMVVGDTSPGYFAHDGGISRTLDGYAGLDTGSCSGTNQFDSLSQTLGSMTEFVSISLHPTNAAILLGGAENNNGSPKTSTATESSTWQNALGGDGGFTAINPTNPDEWFAANPYVAIFECDSATGTGTECNDNTFSQVVGSNDLGGDQGAYITPFILDPNNPSEMLVGTCRVWRISTSGTSPLELSNDFDTLGTGVCTGDEINLVTALAAGGPPNGTTGDSETVYAVTDGYGPLSGSPGGEVWATTDAGYSLMLNVSGNVNPNGYAISSVAMDSSVESGNTAYVGIMGFSTPSYPTSHVWKTTNAGASWTDWTGTGLPDAPVNALLVDSQAGLVYAGTDVGVFVSPTTTASWTEVGPTPGPGVSGFLPNAPVTALQLFNPPNTGTKMLVASTYGRGVWNYPLLPDYTNTISNSPQTIFLSQLATFNGTLTAENGYASKVNLSCTGTAPATCTFNPAQATPTTTYTLTAGGSVGDYTFIAQAVGTDLYKITNNALVTLHVVDFNVTSPSPNSLTVAQGGTSGASTFQVTAAGSFTGTVTLSCPTGLPAGAACVFSPSSTVSPTSSTPVPVTLTVTTAPDTPLGGPVAVTILAMSAGVPAANKPTFNLTVTAANTGFTWTDTGNSSVSAKAGLSATYSFSAVPVDGGTFSSTVTFACSGLPLSTSGGAGAQCAFNPTTIAAGSGTTAVTLTISTLGPNAAAQVKQAVLHTPWTITGGSRPYAFTTRPRTLPFFALAWVALVGIVGMGRKRHGRPALYGGVAVICLVLAGMALISCGGVGGGGGGQPVTVTVSPSSVTVPLGAQQQFTATVNNSSDQTVTWAVNGITGGNTTYGKIITNGLYTAPAVAPNPATVTVTATSGVAGSTPGSATVQVGTAVSVAVTVLPGVPSSLFPNNTGWPSQTAQFTATVANATNTAVTWSVTTPSGGSIDSTTGLYAAPSVAAGLPASVTVTAISQADPTKSGSTQETLTPATIPGTYNNILVTATENSVAQSDTVTLIVQ